VAWFTAGLRAVLHCVDTSARRKSQPEGVAPMSQPLRHHLAGLATYTPSSNQSVNAPAIGAVLGVLDRLATDLRRCAEEAESRAAAADERAVMERHAREAEAEARREAETRVAIAEQSARDAIRRAEAAETATRESVEQLRRELLAAIQESVAVMQTANAARATVGQDRYTTERPKDPRHWEEDQDLSHIPQPAAGRAFGRSAPRR
jgi:hypothetical protein